MKFNVLKQTKHWIIEIREDLKEVVFIPVGLGNPCYGYLNETLDGFRFDHVPPKYIKEIGLKAAIKAGMTSIYTNHKK